MGLLAAEDSGQKSNVNADYAGRVFSKLWDFWIEARQKLHFVKSNCDDCATRIESTGESGDLDRRRCPKLLTSD
jgi:hypothetical protein